MLFCLSVTKGVQDLQSTWFFKTPNLFFSVSPRGGGLCFGGFKKTGELSEKQLGEAEKKQITNESGQGLSKKHSGEGGVYRCFLFFLCLSHQKVEMLGIPFKISGTSKETFFVG